MSPLQSALASLQLEVDSFAQGTPRQPGEGTADWFTLRAKSLGLSYLKAIAAQNLEGVSAAPAAEAVYKSGLSKLKEPGA